MERYSDWKFSPEVQKDLEKFLEVVKTRTKRNENIQKFIQIMPQELQCDTVNYDSSVEKNKSEVIVIDSDDSNDAKPTQIPNLSEMTIAQDPVEQVNDTHLQDFIDYIQETIENQENLLKSEDIRKLIKYTDSDISLIFSQINKTISNESINTLGHSIISNKHLDIHDVLKQFCRIILLDKLQNSEFTVTLQILVKEIINNYPTLSRSDILIPLMQTNSNHNEIYTSLIDLLSNSERDSFLRDFIYSCSDLQVWHLSTLQLLINIQTDDSVKRRLIKLLEATADKFNNEKLFWKLVITLIQSLEKGFEDQEAVLSDIIEKNKSLLRNSARKALREWKSTFIE